jgi:nucleotide-binding universal stress UspA family protein
VVSSGSSAVVTLLPQTAAELGADLLVVGSFGRIPLREALCGGVTRSLILDGPIPILVH